MSDTSEAKITVGSDAAGIGKALNTVAGEVMAFFSDICRPAAQELGLLFKDEVQDWRLRNLDRIRQAAQERLKDRIADGPQLRAHPRLVHEVYETGSWIDDEEVQRLWGGLLAASCTPDGCDESNLMFMHLLRELTSSQARIVKHACEASPKWAGGPHRLAVALPGRSLSIEMQEALRIAGVSDVHRLDRELDHLHALDLIDGGLAMFGLHDVVDIRPTALCLHFYVRCQGSRKTPADYFKLPANSTNEAANKAAGALADSPELDEALDEIVRERKGGRTVEAHD